MANKSANAGSRNTMTVSKWFDEWIRLYKVRTVKRNTLDTYQFIYSVHIGPQIGKRRLGSVKDRDLQKLLNVMSDKNYSNGTISLTRIVMNGMFQQACRNHLIANNPCTYLVLPAGTEAKKTTVFTRSQQQLFMSYVTESRYADLFLLALSTGMRCGELGALQRKDVDLKRNVIHVRHTIRFVKGGKYELSTPKSDHSVRSIPLLSAAREILKQPGYASKAPDEFIFAIDGQPIDKGRITREMQRIVRLIRKNGCDFPDCSPHTLRHSFATRCIEAGMKPKVLQEILGHSDISITLNTYVTIQEDEKRRQMHMLDTFVKKNNLAQSACTQQAGQA